jgi:hydrogenase maturation protease
VVEFLASGYDLSDNVEILDTCTVGLASLGLFVGRDHVIVVDAVRATGHAAGAVMCLSPDQVAPRHAACSMHCAALADVLQAAELVGPPPSTTVVVGVQVQDVAECSEQLSPPVDASVPIAAAAVLDELHSLGVRTTPRDSDIDKRIRAALDSYRPDRR